MFVSQSSAPEATWRTADCFRRCGERCDKRNNLYRSVASNKTTRCVCCTFVWNKPEVSLSLCKAFVTNVLKLLVRFSSPSFFPFSLVPSREGEDRIREYLAYVMAQLINLYLFTFAKCHPADRYVHQNSLQRDTHVEWHSSLAHDLSFRVIVQKWDQQ